MQMIICLYNIFGGLEIMRLCILTSLLHLVDVCSTYWMGADTKADAGK